MVKIQQFADRKEYSCELCGSKFSVFGFAERHERWECEVGHEIRTAFSKGEIESIQHLERKRKRERK